MKLNRRSFVSRLNIAGLCAALAALLPRRLDASQGQGFGVLPTRKDWLDWTDDHLDTAYKNYGRGFLKIKEIIYTNDSVSCTKVTYRGTKERCKDLIMKVYRRPGYGLYCNPEFFYPRPSMRVTALGNWQMTYSNTICGVELFLIGQWSGEEDCWIDQGSTGIARIGL